MPRDAILEAYRLVGQPHQVVVDVAEPVGHLLGDDRELAAREPADHVALRQRRRGASAVTSRLRPRMSRIRSGCGFSNTSFSISSSRSSSLSTSGR